MNKWIMIVCIIAYIAHVNGADIAMYDGVSFHAPYTILGYQNREQCERRIVFFEDARQQKFVLKCYDHDRQEAICEYLGSYIGSSVAIPINAVKIVVGGPLLSEINNGTELATLHVRVPGQRLGKWFEATAHGIALKGGLASSTHLNSIMVSEDLCDIVALDIFLNNRDRHSENCFFDEIFDRYYGIDMGDIFLAMRTIDNSDHIMCAKVYEDIAACVARERLVAFENYHFLNSLKSSSLSIYHKKALKRVGVQLKQLLSLYCADTIFALWLQIAQEVRYVYGNYKKTYLKMLLERNEYWVGKVVERIEELTYFC